MTALRLDKLSLTNFRCFAHCEVAFHDRLTVLVAENGSGKTAVLDAAAAALSVFVNTLDTPEKVRRIERSDVRLVLDHEHEQPSRWAAIVSVAEKIGCTAQTLNEWIKKAEVDAGKRAGVPTDTAARLKALERENRELRQANEILRKASAYFAQAELDRRFKP